MQALIRAIASGMRSQAIRYLARSSKNSGFSELKYLLTAQKRKILKSLDSALPTKWYVHFYRTFIKHYN